MDSQIATEDNVKVIEKRTYSGKSFADVDHFVNANDNYIFCRYWTSDKEPRALMLIVHGFGEHSGRHAIMAEKFVECGFLVFSHDHYCHGESEGYRLDLDDYNVYLNDIEHHCSLMKKKYPNLPLFVFGHSMGGALTILFAQRTKHIISHVVLSSPMITKNKQMTQIKVFMAKMLNSALPRLAVGTLDSSFISRKEQEVERYNSDPLVYHGKILMRTALQIYNMADEVEKELPNINFSYIVLHGDHDELCNVSGTKLLHEKSKSADKTIKIFPGGFHELVHDQDPVSSEYASCIIEWLEKRLQTDH